MQDSDDCDAECDVHGVGSGQTGQQWGVSSIASVGVNEYDGTTGTDAHTEAAFERGPQ